MVRRTMGVAVAIALATMISTGAVTVANAQDSDMAAKVAAAKTAQDHEAIADAYSREADAARAEAERHEKMAKSYAGGGKVGQFHADQHCRSIAKRAREQAKDLDALVQAHRAQAKKLAK